MFPAQRKEKQAAWAAGAERTCFLMEPMSDKDMLKEEVGSEKRGDQRQLLSVSQPTPWWKCLFPIFCLHFFLRELGNMGRKNGMTSKLFSADVFMRGELSF